MAYYLPPKTVISTRPPKTEDGVNYDLKPGDNWIDQTSGFWYVVLSIWVSQKAFLTAKIELL